MVLESYKGTFLQVNFSFSLAKTFIFQSFGLESLPWVPDEVSTREDFLNPELSIGFWIRFAARRRCMNTK